MAEISAAENAKMMRDLAQHYWDMGINIVPLGADKRPVITGIYNGAPQRWRWDSWQVQRQTKAYWSDIKKPAYWGDVHGVAGVNGPVTKLATVDFDVPKSGGAPVPFAYVETFLTALGLPLAHNWLVKSPRGGWHAWLIVPDLALPTGKLDNPLKGLPEGYHCEIRWHGHYTALPGSQHPMGVYEWVNEAPDALPCVVEAARLLEAYGCITEAPEPASAPVAGTVGQPVTRASHNGNGHLAYAQKALLEEAQRVRFTTTGRNDQLNASAFALGQLIGAGVLSEAEAEAALFDAAMSCGLGEAEAKATIRSGIRSGRAKPRQLPADNGRSTSQGDTDLYSYGYADECPDPVLFDDAPILTEDNFDALSYRPEDGGILDAWKDYYADKWLYVTGHEKWYGWIGSHWQADEARSLPNQIQSLMDVMNRQAAKQALEAKTAKATAKAAGNESALRAAQATDTVASAMALATKRSSARVSSVIAMAQAWRALPASALNASNTLNLANGTLSLDSFELLPHDPAEGQIYTLPYAYEPGADCPRFRQFLAEVLTLEDGITPDPELAMLFQELWGYSLTNETNFETMAWLSGEGANGKTVALTVLRSLLGPLATTVNFETLGAAGNYDLADLVGKRVALSTEAERSSSIAEDMIKKIVSGETIKARPIYGYPFEYKSTVKLWWAMNDKPQVKDTSKAFWRRLLLIPFNRSFAGDPNRDPNLIEKLLYERSGILNWALEGLQRLRYTGQFTQPSAVALALAEYKREANPVAQWLEECCTLGTDEEALASVVYASYVAWAKENGRHVLNNTNFGKELLRLGVKRGKRSNVGKRWVITLSKLSVDEESDQPNPGGLGL